MLRSVRPNLTRPKNIAPESDATEWHKVQMLSLPDQRNGICLAIVVREERLEEKAIIELEQEVRPIP